jgi:Tripartite ATP-independent periplasmic transporters, DctQ component
MVEVATRIVVLGVALCFIYFGYLNFLRGFSSFRMPSMTPISSLYAAIPICGALIALFTVEQLVNGLRNCFECDEPPEPPAARGVDRRTRARAHARTGRAVVNDTSLVLFVTFLFLLFGYMGVPVAFSLLAGTLIGAMFTDVSHTAIIQKMFDGRTTRRCSQSRFSSWSAS